MEKKYLIPLAALSVLGMTNLSAARDTGRNGCAPEPPATCYPDDCCRTYCLGPENYGVNAPVCPLTCNGDFTITAAGFYWNTHQDGMEYAIDNHVKNPNVSDESEDFGQFWPDILALNNLIDSEYKTPDFDWDFGFKFGVGYCTTCDSWDISVLWTWYRGKANDHIEAEADDNHTLLPLWSAFAPAQGSILYATDIETHWKLQLNLIDIELGRNFWTSKYLAIRPFVGLRFASLEQDFEIQHKGGSWSARTQDPLQDAYNNEVDMDNDYKGVGLRAGLDSTWNFGCGWALYGNLAGSIVYGKFDIDYDEENRRASNPHDKIKLAEYKDNFRASRAMLDLALGVQWSTMFCDCQYGFMAALGWEHHLFFDQNQLWRIVRIGDASNAPSSLTENGEALPNNQGENVYHQRRGDLDTQGWTLTFKFSF